MGIGRGFRQGLLLVACLVALCAAPAGAAARPRSRQGESPPEACPVEHVKLNVSYTCAEEFTVRGTRGYTITVSASPGANEVELSAVGSEGAAQYDVRGKVTNESIVASFGKLGRIAVSFEPSGREGKEKVGPKCQKERPPTVTARLGRFVGTIEFAGERGYTKVDTHSAAGGIGDPLAIAGEKPTCEFHESEAQRKKELELISLDGSPATGKVFFSAVRLFGNIPIQLPAKRLPPAGDRYFFSVAATEKAGPVTIMRSNGALGEAKDFTYDPSLDSATVSPPAPFSGTGSFVRNADGSTGWTGSLAAPLPGLGKVALTGGEAELATVEEQLERILGAPLH
jgi:hypothetical protein